MHCRARSGAGHTRRPSMHKPPGRTKIILARIGNGPQPFIYRTRHFKLHSLTRLSERHLQKFATVAESVPDVLAKIPLPLLGMPGGGRAKVLVYPDEDAFVKAGGAPGAAGYYTGRKKAVLLREDTFLKVPPPAGSRLPPKADYDLLVHEFVHLCMHRVIGHTPTWFTEGVAEYFAVAHETGGVYRFDNIIQAIRRRIKQGPHPGMDAIPFPGIVETMALTPETWREKIAYGEPNEARRIYCTSLLIVHTLFHGGQAQLDATRAFLEGIRTRTPLGAKVEQLIPAKDRGKLQERIAAYWRPRGLRISFRTPRG